MFGQVGETQYDLRFSVFGIPVRVHPLFWLIAVIMGGGLLNSLKDPILLLAIWVAVMFVSILVHELGHAFAAREFGWPPHIVLCQFGGYAAYSPRGGHTPQRSIFISFAGPAAGFILYGLIQVFRFCYFDHMEVQPTFFLKFTLLQLEFINLWWGLVNLLPVLPLDGGRICQEVLKLLRFRDWAETAIKISMVVAGAVAVFVFTQRPDDWYPGLLFAYLGYMNYQTYQQFRGGGRGSW